VTRPDLQNEYDTAAALRDDTADVRDTAATHRDTIADDRDQVADTRDQVAGRRDTLADERDRLAERTLDQIGELVTAAHLQRTLATRAAAAADRHHASADRAAWAINRTHAEDDRNDAERDRTASSDDRGSSARDRQVAGLDSLTGALQRGAGRLALVREMAHSTRERTPLVVAFVDVDQMKAMNDSEGHSAGDQLLQYVVATLQAAFRPYDLIIRHGGDEFLCVLPGMRASVAQTRMREVNQWLAATDRPASVTAGLAEMCRGDTDEQLVARADRALYRARAHRNEDHTHGAVPSAIP